MIDLSVPTEEEDAFQLAGGPVPWCTRRGRDRDSGGCVRGLHKPDGCRKCGWVECIYGRWPFWAYRYVPEEDKIELTCPSCGFRQKIEPADRRPQDDMGG